MGRDRRLLFAYAVALLATTALAQDGLNIVATTPPQDANGGYQTWIEPLATALLGAGTPGLFWGTVSANDVNSACNTIVSTGSYSVPATITGYGNTFSTTLTVTAIGGCGAGDNAPVGVQAVWNDDSGRQAAIICTDQFTWSIGCSVYLTGDDVTSLQSQLGGRRKMLSLGGHTITVRAHGASRKILQSCPDTYPSCSSWGSGSCGSAGVADFCPCMCGGGAPPPPSDDDSVENGVACGAGTVGAVGAGVGAALACTALLALAPLCYTAAAAGAVGASVASCSGAIADSCFPGHATVQLENGRVLSMEQLSLGDKVAVLKKDGSLGYESVYLFGHKDELAVANFLRLGLSSDVLQLGGSTNQSEAALEVTPGHFVLIADSNGAVQPKRAMDVKLGDTLWVLDHAQWTDTTDTKTYPLGVVHQEFQKYTVVSITTTTATGLFNPYTTGGTIVVDGVAASAHSEWFADAFFDWMGISRGWLLGLYQAALAPVRFLWSAMGPDAYIKLYNTLDAEVQFASVSSVLSLVSVTARAFQQAAMEALTGVAFWPEKHSVGVGATLEYCSAGLAS